MITSASALDRRRGMVRLVTRDISARMPPSPWLSARMTNRQYFSETVRMSAQTTSDSSPMATGSVAFPPTAVTMVW